MGLINELNGAEELDGLLGEQVFIICACYIYAGKLVGINEMCLKLEDASIVYETGPWLDKRWKDAQKLPNKYHYVTTGMIESFGLGKL